MQKVPFYDAIDALLKSNREFVLQRNLSKHKKDRSKRAKKKAISESSREALIWLYLYSIILFIVPESAYNRALNFSSRTFFGAAPTNLSTNSPPLKKRIVGILRTPYSIATHHSPQHRTYQQRSYRHNLPQVQR